MQFSFSCVQSGSLSVMHYVQLIESEPKYQLAIYAILNSSIRAFSTTNLLNTVLKIFSFTFDTIFTYQFFEFRNAVCNSPNIVQHKKYINNMQLKTLKPVLSQCSHNYVSWFWFCCSPNRNPILENQLNGSPQQHINNEWNMISFFSLHF